MRTGFYLVAGWFFALSAALNIYWPNKLDAGISILAMLICFASYDILKELRK